MLRPPACKDNDLLAQLVVWLYTEMKLGSNDYYILRFPDKIDAGLKKYVSAFLVDARREAYIWEHDGAKVGALLLSVGQSNTPASAAGNA